MTLIKEVLVVEGKMDVAAIDKAVEADCLITEGFNLKKQALKNIEEAYRKRGIIILRYFFSSSAAKSMVG